MLHNIRYYSSIAITYCLTIGTIGVVLSSSHLLSKQVDATKELSVQAKPVPAATKTIVAGKPVRIVVAARAIDLPIDDGHYDFKSKTWSLSDTHAEYATSTALANNYSGTTFIYGHGTNAVFGRLGSNPPPLGTLAQIYTETGRIFTYKLQSVMNLKPNDTQILDNMAGGSPGLIIQTCTGALSEWRTMFKFSFEGVS
jgi:hypothetical protein